ncbi:alpha/beta hydrolase fold domain-containing protein [Candidatus Pacearchaeota archaeon]|nr:alpha/beta hydrolase fold domain-containing protein [Candidatus Pacearchaeota archaeon]
MKETNKLVILYRPYSVYDYRTKRSLMQPPYPMAEGITLKTYHYWIGYTKFKLTYLIPPKKNDALIIYLPGAGFVNINYQMEYMVCSYLAKQTDSLVLFLSHRLAPEYKFPVALNDIVRLIKKMPILSTTLGIDKNKICLMGFSSGGNLALSSLARLYNAKKLISLSLLISPILDFERNLPEIVESSYKDKHIPNSMVKWLSKQYIPGNIKLSHPLLSPLNQKKGILTRLPPSLIVTGDNDYFMGEANLYCKKINNCGGTCLPMTVKNSYHTVGWLKPQYTKNVGAFVRKAFSLNNINKLPNGFFKKDAKNRIEVKRYQPSKSIINNLRMKP